MFSLGEIARFNALRAEYQMKLEEMEVEYEKEKKQAFKSGQEDILDKLIKAGYQIDKSILDYQPDESSSKKSNETNDYPNLAPNQPDRDIPINGNNQEIIVTAEFPTLSNSPDDLGSINDTDKHKEKYVKRKKRVSTASSTVYRRILRSKDCEIIGETPPKSQSQSISIDSTKTANSKTGKASKESDIFEICDNLVSNSLSHTKKSDQHMKKSQDGEQNPNLIEIYPEIDDYLSQSYNFDLKSPRDSHSLSDSGDSENVNDVIQELESLEQELQSIDVPRKYSSTQELTPTSSYPSTIDPFDQPIKHPESSSDTNQETSHDNDPGTNTRTPDYIDMCVKRYQKYILASRNNNELTRKRKCESQGLEYIPRLIRLPDDYWTEDKVLKAIEYVEVRKK